MKKAKLGRPRGAAGIQRQDILNASLEILRKSGPQGLSMRGIATHLKVTPMALYHHVADRSMILRELSDLLYANVSYEHEKRTGSVRQRLEKLLTSYHSIVLKHPNLTIGIFADPDAFSSEANRITQHILELLGEAKLTSASRRIWLNILVDFTHGSSIATAMHLSTAKQKKAATVEQTREYKRGLNKLLDCIF